MATSGKKFAKDDAEEKPSEGRWAFWVSIVTAIAAISAACLSFYGVRLTADVQGKGLDLQREIANESANAALVKEALSILRDEASTKTPELREWAVRTINQLSPVKFPNKLAAALTDGTVTLSKLTDDADRAAVRFTQEINDLRAALNLLSRDTRFHGPTSGPDVQKKEPLVHKDEPSVRKNEPLVYEKESPVGDTWITTKVKSELLGATAVKGTDIHVSTVNGVVTLAGVLDNEPAIERAILIAKSVKGVTYVDARALKAQK